MKTRNTRTLFRILVTLVTLSMLVVSCAPAATQEAASSSAAETGQETASTPAAEVSQGEAGSGEISVLYLDDPTFWSEQAQRFTEASGIKVNWEGVPFLQLHDKMLTALATGDSPWDAIHVRDDYVAEFASRGFLLPLDDLITPEMKAQSPEQAWENLSWDGHIYGIPRYFWVWQFYYNTDILSSAGITEVPTTWDEVAQAAEAITADTDGDGEIDRWGYCEPWGENFASYPFLIHLRAAGGDVFDADGNPIFNSEAGVKALTWMVEYAKTDNYCPSAFENDHVPMVLLIFRGNGIWLKSRFPITKSDPFTYSARNKGISSGSCCPSASRVRTASYPCCMAWRKPFKSAAPFPWLGSCLTTCAPRLRAISEVLSRDPSSTTNTGRYCMVWVITPVIRSASL